MDCCCRDSQKVGAEYVNYVFNANMRDQILLPYDIFTLI